MNKMEISKDLYRQNVYNINTGDGHYHHFTCYFDNSKNVFMVFSAGVNHNMTVFEESTDLTPLQLPDSVMDTIKNVLMSWTYDHIQPVDLYNPDSMWNNSCKGIFEITERDTFVIESLKPLDKTQRLTSYVSGSGLTVYETEQYNKNAGEWYIVGDSSTNLDLITARMEHHNGIIGANL
jgi:hypothetical protein